MKALFIKIKEYFIDLQKIEYKESINEKFRERLLYCKDYERRN